MSSSVQLSHCKDCGILLPSSKMVPPRSRDLSVNRRQHRTLRKMPLHVDIAGICISYDSFTNCHQNYQMFKLLIPQGVKQYCSGTDLGLMVTDFQNNKYLLDGSRAIFSHEIFWICLSFTSPFGGFWEILKNLIDFHKTVETGMNLCLTFGSRNCEIIWVWRHLYLIVSSPGILVARKNCTKNSIFFKWQSKLF